MCYLIGRVETEKQEKKCKSQFMFQHKVLAVCIGCANDVWVEKSFFYCFICQRGTGLYITELCFASTIRREIAIQRICMCYIQLMLETRNSKQ